VIKQKRECNPESANEKEILKEAFSGFAELLEKE